MQAFWRSLPGLLLLAALGLGLAYLGTGFLPRPEPALRPPEELRAQGQALADESPARAVLERNVLGLERPALAPPGSPPAPPQAASKPLAAPVPEQKPAAQTPGANLSGGPAAPAAAPAGPKAP